MITSKYFKPSEFCSCNPPCSIDDMDPNFIELLDVLRAQLGKPIVLNSAFRSKEYELSKQRSGKSSHCSGLAVDIRCTNSKYRMLLVKTALQLGFHRIGIGETFVHLDLDPTKSPNVVWLY